MYPVFVFVFVFAFFLLVAQFFVRTVTKCLFILCLLIYCMFVVRYPDVYNRRQKSTNKYGGVGGSETPKHISVPSKHISMPSKHISVPSNYI